MFAENETAIARHESRGPTTASAGSASFSEELESNVAAAVDRPKESVDSEPASTCPDDLVYLALSNKVETAVRDRMAYRLHRRWANKHHVVREWPVTGDSTSKRRIDFGVTLGGCQCKDVSHVLALTHAFELKSFYSYDIEFGHKCGLFANLAAAVRTIRHPEMAKSLHMEARRFALLTVTHLQCDPEATAVHLLAKSYRRGVRKLCPEVWDANRFDPTHRYKEASRHEGLGEPQLVCARYCSSIEPIHGATVSLGYWLYRHD